MPRSLPCWRSSPAAIARASLPSSTGWRTLRDELNARLEQARTAMRELMLAAASQTRAEQDRVVQISIVVSVLAAILGLGLAAVMTAALVRPVKRLLAGTRAIETGALDIEIPVTSSDEIGGLTTAFNHMIGELRAKARIRDTFGKYVDPRIVAGLIDRPELAPEGERRTMTVFFCDMKGFSALGEQLTPKNLVAVTNRYLSVMSEPVRAQGGILDKYIGDAIMAYWGPPFTEGVAQAGGACLAALEMIGRLRPFLDELPELTGLRRGLPDLGLRIGIATGPVLVGNIGSEVMKSYTVLGGSVNLAARLGGGQQALRDRHPGIGGYRLDGRGHRRAARDRHGHRHRNAGTGARLRGDGAQGNAGRALPAAPRAI